MEEVGRRERKKRQTRARIRAAALDLFAEHGFRDTTIAAVADRADVATRTVTLHFPAKEDLLLADDPYTVASLRSHLHARKAGEDTLDAVRAWMWTTMQAIDTGDAADTADTADSGGSGWDWRQRSLRARLLMDDDDLRGRARAGYHELEQLVADGVGTDLGLPADALVARLTATTVVAGLREVHVTREGRERAATSPGDLVDRVIAFARAGMAALAADDAARGPPGR